MYKACYINKIIDGNNYLIIETDSNNSAPCYSGGQMEETETHSSYDNRDKHEDKHISDIIKELLKDDIPMEETDKESTLENLTFGESMLLKNTAL